jgi:hypothetical protein
MKVNAAFEILVRLFQDGSSSALVKQLMFARHSCHQGHLPPISLHLAPLSVAAQTGAEKSPLPGSRRGGDETPFDGMSSTMPLNKPIK